MADDEERSPPPPSYEEVQQLLRSELTVSTADTSDPHSVPLLANQTQNGLNLQSRIPVTHSTSLPPYTGTTVLHTDRLSSHQEPSSGSHPIFVCGACGARQSFGQFSPITSQGLPSQSVAIPSPIYVGNPVITNRQNPPYPVTGRTSSHPPVYQSLTESQNIGEPRDVAVDFNVTQGRAQAQVNNSDSSSSNEDDSSKTLWACKLFFFAAVFIGVILFVSVTLS